MVKEEEEEEEGSGGFSHPSICPPLFIGGVGVCVSVRLNVRGGDNQQWMCQHFERLKQDTLRYNLTLAASQSATGTASAARTILLNFIRKTVFFNCW